MLLTKAAKIFNQQRKRVCFLKIQFLKTANLTIENKDDLYLVCFYFIDH